MAEKTQEEIQRAQALAAARLAAHNQLVDILVARLRADVAVSRLCGARVHSAMEGVIPEVYPWLMVTRGTVTELPEGNTQGAATVRVLVYDDDESGMQVTAAAVRLALSGFGPEGILRACLAVDRGTVDQTDDLWVRAEDFRVYWVWPGAEG